MQIQPPSLAARLERDGSLPWREAAGLAAEIARLLDRLHAGGRVHGGVEPLAVLFVGSALRLADPLPAAKGARGRRRHAPATTGPSLAGGRQRDFASLGETFARMLGGAGEIQSLPPAVREVVTRCTTADPARVFRSGNEIADALELALAASEATPRVERQASPATDGRVAQRVAPPPAKVAPVPVRRRGSNVGHRWVLLMLCGMLLLGGAAITYLRRAPEPTPPAALTEDEPDAPVEETEALVELLAVLPEQPLVEEPPRPAAETVLREILANAEEQPCQRLDVEEIGPDLRLVGRTTNDTDRDSILVMLEPLKEAVEVAIDVDRSERFCALYDVLGRRTTTAMPRLAHLYPRRASHRLSYGEALMIEVRMPADPSYLTVDYFTADGMVVHLRAADVEEAALSPLTEIVVGNPLDGPSLQIGPPAGDELVLVLATATPPFSRSRPPAEKADGYVAALDTALGQRALSPLASILRIEAVPVAD